SALMCYVDLKTGKLISANAGHLPILRLSNSGEVDLIRSKGKIIHETFPTGCEENICNLRKGDKIILYTDGVTEARNENYEMFGEELLIQSARENSMRDAVFTCNDIFESVMRFTGSLQKLEDDFTILTLEYHGRNSSSGKL
ncbi:MAG: serine/threonine-protein phosphatase, partial [Leptospira sp.]|nr:serine/threonine-protein phosphatase [Leptospira sp.]